MTTATLPTPKKILSMDDIEMALEKKNANFTVGRIKTPNPVYGHKGEETGFYTAYRTDTGKVFQQGLSSRWHPIQNTDVFKCLVDLSKVTAVDLMDIRSFNGGAEIAAQLSLGDFFVDDAKKDRISKYLSVIFAHDGTRALSLFLTSLRWGCSNCITPSFMAARAASKVGKKTILTIQHSVTAQDKLEQLVKCVSVAHDEFQHTEQLYRTLRNTEIDKEMMNKVISEFFPIDKGVTPRKRKNWTDKIMDISNRYQHADGGLQEKNTAWNLYNAVQGHLQHYGKDSEAQYKSNLIGPHATTAAEVMRTIIEMSIGMNSLSFSSLTKKIEK